MPNITVRVSESAYRNARVWAAEHGESLSSIVQLCIENLPNMRVRRDGSIAIVTRRYKPVFPPLRTMEDVRRAQIELAEKTLAASKAQSHSARPANSATPLTPLAPLTPLRTVHC